MTSRRHVPQPIFGFVLLGGALTGARVRDVTLINELVRQGFDCHVWWAYEFDRDAGLHSRVPQKWLFHLHRFANWLPRLLGRTAGRDLDDQLGRVGGWLGGESLRHAIRSRCPSMIDWALTGMIREVIAGVAHDAPLIRRFASQLDEAGVTHLLPMLSVFAPWCRVATQQMRCPAQYAITFQGYEVYGCAARRAGIGRDFLTCLQSETRAAPLPPIAVSRPYAARIEQEVGIAANQFRIIPPGVEFPDPLDDAVADRLVQEHLGIDAHADPLVTYVGRQDSEKGIDLLLYAARLAQQRGARFRLVIVGANGFGLDYLRTCQQIAGHLQLNVSWHGRIATDARNALMQRSRCVVYPSIHDEPFGIVPVEAMAMGTPVIVPDRGGVSELVEDGQRQAGLRFRSWDTADLASRLIEIVTDDAIHRELSAQTSQIAGRFSVETCAERTLSLCLDSEPRSGMSLQSTRVWRRSA